VKILQTVVFTNPFADWEEAEKARDEAEAAGEVVEEGRGAGGAKKKQKKNPYMNGGEGFDAAEAKYKVPEGASSFV
jgi:hypothetical protein